MTDKQAPEQGWDVKVTSKGQVTLPKKARDVLMVREGDHLQAVIHDDSLVLRRRDDIPESERARLCALRDLLDMGIDPHAPHPELSPKRVRELMPNLRVSLVDRVRAQRDNKEEP